MLAINHATLATAAVFAGSYYFNQPFFLPLILFVIFSGVAPDIDHPGSELGQLFKPVARLLPHRGITHTILGTAIFGSGLYFLFGADNQYLTYFLIFCAFFGVYLMNKILAGHINSLNEKTRNLISEKQVKILLKVANFVVYGFLFSLLLVVWNPILKNQVFSLLLIGYVLHIVGDFVTIEGVPVFFPHKKKLGLKLFRTGSKTETMIGFLLFLANFYFLYQLNLRDNFVSLEYWRRYLSV